jgi:phosphoglycolate phosphatase-like HAD superfamily hydrolase
MELVGQRISKFGRGELDISDYTIKGALKFLEALRRSGIKLYLASGTDHQDVVNEATALGYAHLFDGGIYGALSRAARLPRESVGQEVSYENCKKMVIERIMRENKLQGPELAVFGDGPVEMRESRKRDGLAVGIASDEIRRHGLNVEKRTRLVKAGAHIIVPDFSQQDGLLKLLFKE